MERIRVIGICRERLLAAKLSVKMLLGSQMPQAGLIERSNCRNDGAARRFPRISGGSPALATIHLCITN
jgi:hypothetical protein